MSGLANVAGDPVDAGSGPHSRTSGCYLNGVRVKHTEGADLRAGRTMDQFAADELGKLDRLVSENSISKTEYARLRARLLQ